MKPAELLQQSQKILNITIQLLVKVEELTMEGLWDLSELFTIFYI